ncbi:MAG TPA: CoA-binding protein, partial [Burkholderiales bacterium]|nr:CoA-binding protein [Burkholderiales bacterium]
MPRHYLQPLLAPTSVALVGATEREGALGNIVYRNLAAAGLRGPLWAVNPKHSTIFGAKAYARLGDLPEKPELAVIVTPARTVPGIVREAGEAGIKAAAVLTSGFAEVGAAGSVLQAELVGAARQGGVRVLGPNCLGLMRTDVGLNATFARSYAHAGQLALVSQSGAM